MHLLRGERSPFLWGSGYQTSADSFVAAIFFAAAGPSPLALMLSALCLHVLSTWLVFQTLRRRLDPWTSLVVTLPLVLAPASIHSYALYPPRQLSLTLAVAALWAIDGAAARASARASGFLALGGLLFGLAVSADPYPLVLAPIILGYALLVLLEQPWDHLPWFGTATLAGFVPFGLLHQAARGKSGPLGLTTNVLRHNWDLLVRECLPWALSYKVYFARHVMDYLPWDAPALVQIVQLMGAFVVAAIVGIGLAVVFRTSVPWSERRLGFLGALTFPVAIGAFLVSVMVMDHFSMRYLAVLTLMLPIASLPAAELLGGKRFALLLAPHLVASALCGWVGYGSFVRGVVPVRADAAERRDDDALASLLDARGIRYAEADYWVSYRLTFLFRERFIVVPKNVDEDRYAPYRNAFDSAPSFAYVFDPDRSRESLADAESALTRTNAHVEKVAMGSRTVLLVDRAR
jgi:hypothetical protein